MGKESRRDYEAPKIITIPIDYFTRLVMHSNEGGPPPGPFGAPAKSQNVFPDSPFPDEERPIFNRSSSPFER